jgi:uncharacterized protein (TIGR02757 family)
MQEFLDALYARYNRPEHAEHDPVSFLYDYDDPRDREIAALVAASLAYGRLAQIMDSVADALGRLGEHPAEFLAGSPPQTLRRASRWFVHRFAHADRFWRLLWGVKDVLAAHGTLQGCFLAHDDPEAETVLAGLTGLAHELAAGGNGPSHLVADPAAGSACKRWHLFLRWMVRNDAVDPGGWGCVSPARLVMPLDTHTWRVCRSLDLVERGTCDMKAALEATDSFRRFSPEDPVKYDFALMHASEEGELPEAPA